MNPVDKMLQEMQREMDQNPDALDELWREVLDVLVRHKMNGQQAMVIAWYVLGGVQFNSSLEHNRPLMGVALAKLLGAELATLNEPGGVKELLEIVASGAMKPSQD